ncbi:hypothetical protein EDB85DRAFT_1893491 [Lactarius pseudohatsudake]|nr:hypothetical protein EDB85DRAFT_1893491 [Lactarius pseudohatsudake]
MNMVFWLGQNMTWHAAWEDFDYDAARTKGQGGIVVTGQPGIGTPVSLQLAPQAHILVFRDDGVYRHPQDAEPDYLPTGTWALSDTGRLDEKPCNTFLKAAGQHTAWIIQTAPPIGGEVETVGKAVYCGYVQGLDASALLRNYEKWGPSARTCVQLARDPAKGRYHAIVVNNAADAFVERPPPRTTFDAIEVFHVLFSVRPEVEEDRGGGRVPVAVMATEHIKRIISCAAAGAVARKRIEFYRIISTQPSFKVSAGKMFEGFVLSWLYAGSNLNLEIPACGEEQTTFFDGKNSLEKVNRDKLPLCLLPTSKDFPTADAIIITDEFIITIQVITFGRHSAKGSDLADIKKLIPPSLGRDKWCHVFITDNDSSLRAISLRNQTLPELPKDILVYSGVFNIGWSGVTRKHMESFNEKRVRLHAIGAYRGTAGNLPTNNPPAEIHGFIARVVCRLDLFVVLMLPRTSLQTAITAGTEPPQNTGTSAASCGLGAGEGREKKRREEFAEPPARTASPTVTFLAG